MILHVSNLLQRAPRVFPASITAALNKTRKLRHPERSFQIRCAGGWRNKQFSHE
jgi:hypothetical protein